MTQGPQELLEEALFQALASRSFLICRSSVEQELALFGVDPDILEAVVGKTDENSDDEVVEQAVLAVKRHGDQIITTLRDQLLATYGTLYAAFGVLDADQSYELELDEFVGALLPLFQASATESSELASEDALRRAFVLLTGTSKEGIRLHTHEFVTRLSGFSEGQLTSFREFLLAEHKGLSNAWEALSEAKGSKEVLIHQERFLEACSAFVAEVCSESSRPCSSSSKTGGGDSPDDAVQMLEGDELRERVLRLYMVLDRTLTGSISKTDFQRELADAAPLAGIQQFRMRVLIQHSGWRNAFNALDDSGDAKLELRELEECCATFDIGEVDARIIFQTFDADSSGELELKEFLAGLSEDGVGFTPAELGLRMFIGAASGPNNSGRTVAEQFKALSTLDRSYQLQDFASDLFGIDFDNSKTDQNVTDGKSKKKRSGKGTKHAGTGHLTVSPPLSQTEVTQLYQSLKGSKRNVTLTDLRVAVEASPISDVLACNASGYSTGDTAWIRYRVKRELQPELLASPMIGMVPSEMKWSSGGGGGWFLRGEQVFDLQGPKVFLPKKKLEGVLQLTIPSVRVFEPHDFRIFSSPDGKKIGKQVGGGIPFAIFPPPPSQPQAFDINRTSARLIWEVPSNYMEHDKVTAEGYIVKATPLAHPFEESTVGNSRFSMKPAWSFRLQKITKVCCYEMEGLLPGRSYNFQVVPLHRNSESGHVEEGTGSPISSLVSTPISVKPEKPGAPKIVQQRHRELELKWTLPKWDGGGAIHCYRLFWNSKEVDGSQYSLMISAWPPIVRCIVKLPCTKEEAEVTFTCAAENAAGVGEISDPSVALQLMSDTEGSVFLDDIFQSGPASLDTAASNLTGGHNELRWLILPASLAPEEAQKQEARKAEVDAAVKERELIKQLVGPGGYEKLLAEAYELAAAQANADGASSGTKSMLDMTPMQRALADMGISSEEDQEAWMNLMQQCKDSAGKTSIQDLLSLQKSLSESNQTNSIQDLVDLQKALGESGGKTSVQDLVSLTKTLPGGANAVQDLVDLQKALGESGGKTSVQDLVSLTKTIGESGGATAVQDLVSLQKALGESGGKTSVQDLVSLTKTIGESGGATAVQDLVSLQKALGESGGKVSVQDLVSVTKTIGESGGATAVQDLVSLQKSLTESGGAVNDLLSLQKAFEGKTTANVQELVQLQKNLDESGGAVNDLLSLQKAFAGKTTANVQELVQLQKNLDESGGAVNDLLSLQKAFEGKTTANVQDLVKLQKTLDESGGKTSVQDLVSLQKTLGDSGGATAVQDLMSLQKSIAQSGGAVNDLLSLQKAFEGSTPASIQELKQLQKTLDESGGKTSVQDLMSLQKTLGDSGGGVDLRSAVGAAERLASLGLDLSENSELIELLATGVRCSGSASEFLTNLQEMNRSREDQGEEQGEKLAGIVEILRGPKKSHGGEHTEGWKRLLTRTEDAGGIHKLIHVVESHDLNKVYASIDLGKAAGLRTGNLAQKDAALWGKLVHAVRKAGGAAAFLHACGEEGDDLMCLGQDLDMLRRLRKAWKSEALTSSLEFLQAVVEHADNDVAKAFAELNPCVLGEMVAASKVAGGPGQLLKKLSSLDGKKWPQALDLLVTMGITKASVDPKKTEADLRDWNTLVDAVQQNGGPDVVLPKFKQVVSVTDLEHLMDVLRSAGLLGPEPAPLEDIQRWKSICAAVKECNDLDLILEAAKGGQLSFLLKAVPALRRAGLLLEPSESDSRPSTPIGCGKAATSYLEDLANRVAEAGGAQVFAWALRDADFSTLRHDLHVCRVLRHHVSPNSWDLLNHGACVVELFEAIDSHGGIEEFLTHRMGTSPLERDRTVSNVSGASLQSPLSRSMASGTPMNRFRAGSALASQQMGKHHHQPMLSPHGNERRESKSTPLAGRMSGVVTTVLEVAHHPHLDETTPSSAISNSGNTNGRPHTESLDAVFDVDPSALESLASLIRNTRRPQEDVALIVGLWRKAEGPGPSRVLSLLEAMDERFWSLQPENNWEQVMKCIEVVQLRRIRLNELLSKELRHQKIDDVTLSRTHEYITLAGGPAAFVETMGALDWPLGLHHGAEVLSTLRALANSTDMIEWHALSGKAFQAGGVGKLLDAIDGKLPESAPSRNGRRQVWSRSPGSSHKKHFMSQSGQNFTRSLVEKDTGLWRSASAPQGGLLPRTNIPPVVRVSTPLGQDGHVLPRLCELPRVQAAMAEDVAKDAAGAEAKKKK